MTKAAVIGMGTMGPGIAATLSRGGMVVSCHDSNEKALAASGGLIAAAAAVLEALNVPDQGNGAEIAFSSDLEETVAGADLVIETVPEILDLKRDLLRKLDGLVDKDCVLASDTSGIPISQLQVGVSNPGRVIGMHWSNPPHIIPIIEVIAGEKTSPGVVDWMVKIIRQINLRPIVVKKDVPGFVENRVLYALLRECVDLVETGVIDAEDLDACVSWGIGYKLSVVGPDILRVLDQRQRRCGDRTINGTRPFDMRAAVRMRSEVDSEDTLNSGFTEVDGKVGGTCFQWNVVAVRIDGADHEIL